MIPKETIKGILLEQEKKIGKIKSDEFVIREKIHEIQKFIELKHAIIITGVRRCGKSVFLSQIMNMISDGFYYINFEDERLSGFDVGDFNSLYEVCIELFGKNRTFFLDEVQNIEGWEKWVRRMYEDGFKFFITGSNARLLSKELATHLTGRHIQFSLYPFNFREFLSFNKLEFKEKELYLTEKRAEIKKLFSKYVKLGGFPEYLKYMQQEILQEYFGNIVQRDVVERYKIKNIKQLRVLAVYLISNSGNMSSYNQLRKLTELRSVNTAINYISYLENAYILFTVPYFSYSLRKQAANPFKTYSIDTGLTGSVSFKFSKDLGRAYENIVALELKRRNSDIYYWKNRQHEEVDFVIKEEKVKQLIQVCYKIDDPGVKEREIRALFKASRELKCSNLLIITGELEKEEKIGGKKIVFIPLWKWLLS